MYNEDDLIQLSALQHFIFCPRQCALSYIEQSWEENIFTAEGGVMHERAHEEKTEIRDGARIERGMALRSLRLGLIGKADVVEFHYTFGDRPIAPTSVQLRDCVPFPVEYKRGKPKENHCDKVQLCAQALCLEEMLNIDVPAGAIFYGKIRHRLDVSFDKELCEETEIIAIKVREFIKAGQTPPAVYSSKCDSCSLLNFCMPKVFQGQKSVERYLKESISNEKIS